ncbi:unnamed protein product [Phytophthora fragariaefolia]|uniref:Unnamed protein product n=1 Tax=Phytophthora fragariaefolia TaxID=1490495 RepID=A0A9W6XHM0_9STRA|nr:unnamed protein product [Phytophthora fragariaefolia]
MVAPVAHAAVRDGADVGRVQDQHHARPSHEADQQAGQGDTARVTACGEQQVANLNNVYFAKDDVQYLISYALLDKEGFKLAQRSGRRVVAAENGDAWRDVKMRYNVLVAPVTAATRHESPSDVIMAV